LNPVSAPTATAPISGGEARAEVRLTFADAYAEFFPFVWRCLRSLGVPDTALDDASQDVFLVVHRQLSRFEGRSSLRTWLYGIARKVAFNHRRRQKRSAHGEPLDKEPPSPHLDPSQVLEQVEAVRFMQGFLETLSDAKRDVFILAVLEQWSAPEVAEALKIPVNTVYSRLRAARLDFQAALSRYEEIHERR
jgi:RNA polymerase sigma-70 factor (ECF subfamily)